MVEGKGRKGLKMMVGSGNLYKNETRIQKCTFGRHSDLFSDGVPGM